MKLARNVSAGLVSSVISAAVGLAVVPSYIRVLGIESYGLIGIFATLQALLQVLDFGMGPTVSREIARHPAGAIPADTRSLLHSVAVIYWLVAVAIAGIVAACAGTISTVWQPTSQLSNRNIETAVQLIGVVIACRFPISLYQSAMVGAQDIIVSSAVSLGLSVVGSMGALLVITLISPTIQAFFVWQAACGLVFALIARRLAWRAVRGRSAVTFRPALLKPVGRFSGGMIALTLAGLIFSQLDRLILSRMLPLEAFGKYMLSAVTAGALMLLIGPIYNAIFPRFSQLLAAGDMGAALELYAIATRIISALLFPLAVVLFVFGKDIIQLWTGNAQLAADVSVIVSLLAIGNALHGTMYVPHALQLAFGNVRIPVAINMVLMLMIAPLIVSLTLTYGAVGGAVAWLILHVCYILLCTVLTHRYLIPQTSGTKWLVHNILLPFLIACVFAVAGRAAVSSLNFDLFLKCVLCVSLYSATLMGIVATAPKLRRAVFSRLSAQSSRLGEAS